MKSNGAKRIKRKTRGELQAKDTWYPRLIKDLEGFLAAYAASCTPEEIVETPASAGAVIHEVIGDLLYQARNNARGAIRKRVLGDGFQRRGERRVGEDEEAGHRVRLLKAGGSRRRRCRPPRGQDHRRRPAPLPGTASVP